MSTSTGPYPLSESEEQLEQVLAECLRAAANGHTLDRQALLARHPHLAEELRSFFDNCDYVDERAGRLRFDVPEKVGDYELLEVLGSGAFGVVLKARHAQLDSLVAVKLLRGEQWSSSEYVRRFQAEAQKAAKLDHPHIVPVHHVGEHESQHYYVMRLIEGGSLAERLRNIKAEERSTHQHQRWAAALIARVARAVHHAHQHAILHCDLKSSNILLDAEEKPHVTDFGLAKHLEEGRLLFEMGPVADDAGRMNDALTDTLLTEKGVIVGTPPYMSPEQAAGQELSTASDLYSLGVILFEILTGEVPIRGATTEETLQRIQKETPPPPRKLNPLIDRRLEAICRKCLQRHPEDRYGSALGLARNLERWLENRPLVDPPDTFSERCRLWCRRNPVLAGLGAMGIMLFLLVTVLAVYTSRARGARLEEEILKSNAYAAQGVASTVLSQLRQLADPVEQAAGEQQLRRLMIQEDRRGLQEYLNRTLPSWNKRFPEAGDVITTSRILDTNGLVVAGWPEGAHTVGESYAYREYFRGTIERARRSGDLSVHVSGVFHSHSDRLHKFALAAPIRDPHEAHSRILGIITATIVTGSSMGLPQLHDERRKAVLVARVDPTLSDAQPVSAAPASYSIHLHPAFRRGEEPVAIANPKLGALMERPRSTEELHLPEALQNSDHFLVTESDYYDPVGAKHPEYEGRWLAGFAPVGNTGFAVIVQQRYDEAIPSDGGLVWGAAAVLLGVSLVIGLGWLALKLSWEHRSLAEPAKSER